VSADGRIVVVALAESRELEVFSVSVAEDDKTARPIVERTIFIATNHKDLITNVMISPSRSFVATSCQGQDTRIQLFSSRTGALLHLLDSKQIINYTTALSPCGNMLACGAQMSEVKVWNTPVGKDGVLGQVRLATTLKRHAKGAFAVCFGADERGVTDTMATGSGDGVVRCWDVNVQFDRKEEPDLLATLQLSSAASCLALAPGGSCVLAVAVGADLFFYHKKTGALLETVEAAHRGEQIRRLRWNRNGKVLASLGADKAIKLFKSPSL
jgi:WD40 repeat protein